MRIKSSPNKMEIEDAKRTGQLLLLWLEIWPHCHLNCGFCFNHGGWAAKSPDWLTINDYYRIIDEFVALRGKYLGIPGYGEPFHSSNLNLTLDILKHALQKGVKSYIFTTADLINEELARQLKELDVTLMVKFNSFNEEVQDSLVGSRGYTARRTRSLNLLLKLGFNKPQFDEECAITQLAFVTSIIPENREEIAKIWEYCHENNIFPDIDTILPKGRGKDYATSSTESIQKIFLALTGAEVKSPTYINGHCDRTMYGLYINYKGEIFPCLGCKGENGDKISIGHVEGGLVQAWNSPLEKKIRHRDYSGKCTSCEHFQKHECNSCFGRCCTQCSENYIEMSGCPFYKKGSL